MMLKYFIVPLQCSGITTPPGLFDLAAPHNFALLNSFVTFFAPTCFLLLIIVNTFRLRRLLRRGQLAGLRLVFGKKGYLALVAAIIGLLCVALGLLWFNALDAWETSLILGGCPFHSASSAFESAALPAGGIVFGGLVLLAGAQIGYSSFINQIFEGINRVTQEQRN